MEGESAADVVKGWPEESREPAQLVLDKYGEPDEVTETALTWHKVGPWKRIVAQKAWWQHDFPAPHMDSVESFLDYKVAPEHFTPLAEYDGSVMVERTTGEVSARCHDEEANTLALNLMHDIVTGQKTVEGARQYYAQEFLDARRKKPTPYMDELRFHQGSDAPDPDTRLLSDEELERAVEEGKQAAETGSTA